MSDKVPFEKYMTHYGWDFRQIELTGKCKRVTYPRGSTCEYAQCQRRIFGIKLWTYWIDKDYIAWGEKKKVEYYDCNFGK